MDEQKDMSAGADSADSLLSLNQLAYRKPTPLSVASSTQWRVFRALRDGAPATQSQIDITPGASFIDPRVSYLEFTITAGAGGFTPYTAGASVGAFAYIGESVVRSRSGVELSRSREQGMSRHIIERYTRDFNYFQTIGAATYAANDAPALAPGASRTYIIPLCSVNPFFTTTSLIPSQLGQMRLELTWESAVRSGTAGTWIVEGIRVVCKTYDLADMALKRLSYIASQTGLTLAYTDISTTNSSTVGNFLNAVSLKSASRAMYAFVLTRSNDADDQVRRSFASLAIADDNIYQFSLGSQFITAENVVGPDAAMMHANEAFGMWGREGEDGNVSNCVSRDFVTAEGLGVYACNLERSHVLQYNGSAVSSSRPLLVNGIVSRNAANKVSFYLAYLRLAIVFSDSNIALKE